MEVYTYTQARQRLAELLEKAEVEGEVRIQRRNGRIFVVRPERRKGSPLAVQGLDLGMTAEEILEYIREGRERPVLG